MSFKVGDIVDVTKITQATHFIEHQTSPENTIYREGVVVSENGVLKVKVKVDPAGNTLTIDVETGKSNVDDSVWKITKANLGGRRRRKSRSSRRKRRSTRSKRTRRHRRSRK